MISEFISQQISIRSIYICTCK